MSDRRTPPITSPGVRRDGWTKGKRVTFFVSLAATGSVTFACASVKLSRKSAYALRKRDRTFASLWERALAMAGKPRRKVGPAHPEGNTARSTSAAAARSSGVKPTVADRTREEADRDRFFAILKMRRTGASLRPRIEQGSCQPLETVRR